MREQRAYIHSEVRAANETSRVVTGYAAVFGSPSQPLWGEWREQIQPGAFAESLASEDDIYALWQHSSAQPIASRDAGTLKLEEDKKGLRCEITFGDSSTEEFWYSKIKDGTIKRMSFGFESQEEGTDYDTKMRTLVRVKLFEVSPVTWPAYPATSLSARGFSDPADVFSKFVPVPPQNDAALIEVRRKLYTYRQKSLSVA